MSAEDWDAPEGGQFSEVAGVVETAVFKVNPEYDGIELYLDIKPDDGDGWDEETGLCTVRAAAGPGWDLVSADGAAIVHEQDRDGKLARIKGSTQYGYLINSVRDDEAAREVMGERGSPRNASVWEGLHVELARVVTGTFTPKDSDEPREVRRWKVEELSVASNGEKATTTSNTAQDAGVPVMSNGAFPGTAVQKVKLKKLAEEHADQNAFIEGALVAMPDDVAVTGALQDWVLADGSRELAAAF